MEFLSCPNLPIKKVSYVIVDYRTDENIIAALENQGITVFLSAKVNSLYNAVCGHPDMSIHHLGGCDFVCEPSVYDYYMHTLNLQGINLIKGFSHLTSTYPYDIAYNVARVSRYAFHKTDYTDREILNNSKNINFINVSQGYSKCSVCIIAQNAIITDDDNIYKNACQHGFDVLKINKGGILLEGFDYGFLGGATGLISNDILAITGNVEKHVDYIKITNFCGKYGVKLFNLSDKIPADIGSIIPIAYA